LVELAITSYLACLTKEREVKQICFLLAQYTIDTCLVPKNLGDVANLLTNIQKKWFESYLEKLKLLKNRNIYKVVNLSKEQKAIKNYWIFNIKSNGCYRSQLVVKEFS